MHMWLGSKTERLIVVGAIAVGAIYAQPLRPVVISGKSMQPTYKSGEIVLTALRPDTIQRGEVVVAKVNGSRVIKRVAFVAGDKIPEIRITDRWMYANDFGVPKKHNPRVHFRWEEVPEGTVYLLGDNFTNSTDSRQFGFVKVSDIDRVLLDQRDKQQSNWDRLYSGTHFANDW